MSIITKPYTIKSRPIIFNAEMVRAILDRRKTQTRRVLRPQPVTLDAHVVIKKGKLVIYERAGKQPGALDVTATLNFPLLYGNKGDYLWVRESIRKRDVYPDLGKYGATYIADLTPVMGEGPQGTYVGRALCDWKWKRDTLPSIFMPRWASRITLKITDVKVQQLMSIGIESIRAEGITKEIDEVSHDMFMKFRKLWNSINAKRGYSWESNPWVFVISFERMEEQADESSIPESSTC